jgi:uncharacterized protein YfiM (DUF2279 family)
MIFDDIDSVEKFYKSYAHHVGFGVRIGQQKKLVDDRQQKKLLMWKRFLCDRQGFKLSSSTSTCNSSQKATTTINPSKKKIKKAQKEGNKVWM